MTSMKQFSRTQKITKDNLVGVPSNKPGVYRIKDAKGNVLYIGKAKGGNLDDCIWEHRGRFRVGTQFQYRTTTSKAAVDRLQRQEISKHILTGNKKK